jgi:hypothetical protein
MTNANAVRVSEVISCYSVEQKVVASGAQRFAATSPLAMRLATFLS